MAHRFIIQLAVTGTRVVGRAFAEAYRQANASAAYKKTSGGSSGGGASLTGHAGLNLDEACRILNVGPPNKNIARAPPAEHEAYVGNVSERFKKLFDLNDPNKGGSFYLQSKVLRARERIEAEVGKSGQRAAEESEKQMPKMYKDR